MDPFAAALDAQFNAPGSSSAIFTPKGAAPLVDAIRVIRSQPDRTTGFGEGQIIEGSNRFDIRRADVSEPMRGDLLTIGDETFRLAGDAMLDVEGLTWSIGGSPLA